MAECRKGVELRQSMSDAVETNFGNCQIKSRVLLLSLFSSRRLASSLFNPHFKNFFLKAIYSPSLFGITGAETKESYNL
jgi:hypothetical protein